jgi:hypothetical protein
MIVFAERQPRHTEHEISTLSLNFGDERAKPVAIGTAAGRLPWQVGGTCE